MARTKSVTRKHPSERRHNTRLSTYSATIASRKRYRERNGIPLVPVRNQNFIREAERQANESISKPIKEKRASGNVSMNDAKTPKRQRSEDEPPSHASVECTKEKSGKNGESSNNSGNKTSKKRKVAAQKQSHKQAPARRTPENSHDEKPQEQDEEQRLRRYRPYPPASFLDVQERALSQRMFVIDRTRCDTADCPEERFEIAGTTGNVYSVHIARQPSCNCPHALKGNQCKHVIYILTRVLRAPKRLVYQLALLSSELRKIFASRRANTFYPASSSSTAAAAAAAASSSSLSSESPLPDSSSAPNKKRKKSSKPPPTNQKPIEPDSDCPICAMPLRTKRSNKNTNRTAKAKDEEEIVFCRASCGNNIHKICFETWAAVRSGGMSRLPAGVSSSERNSKKPITVPCPFCREPWELGVDDCYKVTLERAKKVAAKGRRMTMGEMSGAAGAGADAGDHDGVGGDGNDGGAVVVSEEGYVNVARELGIDARRDYSTYHLPWVRSLIARQARTGAPPSS